MKERLTNWATAGDADAMYKLAEILTDEGDKVLAFEWLIKSAEKHYLPAIMKVAEIYHTEKNFEQALKYYKMAVQHDEITAMEKILAMYEAGEISDSESLNFVLEDINQNKYNDIYSRRSLFVTMKLFAVCRGDEYTLNYQDARERRRIANKIKKIQGVF